MAAIRLSVGAIENQLGADLLHIGCRTLIVPDGVSSPQHLMSLVDNATNSTLFGSSVSKECRHHDQCLRLLPEYCEAFAPHLSRA